MGVASRQTSSSSLPSITGGFGARCATPVADGEVDDGGGELFPPDCNATMTATNGVNGVMGYLEGGGYSFDGTIRQMVGFVIAWPGPPTNGFSNESNVGIRAPHASVRGPGRYVRAGHRLAHDAAVNGYDHPRAS